MSTIDKKTYDETLGQSLLNNGVSRRSFLKFCSTVASAMALPPAAAKVMAETLSKANGNRSSGYPSRNVPVVQNPITRSHKPTA